MPQFPNSSTQPTATSATPAGNSSDQFLKTLQDKLMGMSPMVSSNNTKIDSTIKDAIANLQQSRKDTQFATTSAFNRKEQAVNYSGQNSVTTAQETQRGYALNTGLLQNIVNTTNTDIKDLELRKQEALAYGDAQTAGKIATLQMEGLQFKQQAQQKVFTNLLSTANVMLQSSANQRATQAQTFQEHQAISNIALKYGVAIQPGDNIDSITSRASVYADKAQKLDLKKTQAQINEINAQTSKAIAGASANADLTPDGIKSLALAASQGGAAGAAVLGLIKNPNTYSKVINSMVDIQYTGYKSNAQQALLKGATRNDSIQAVQNDTTLSASDKVQYMKAINYVYDNNKKTNTSSTNKKVDNLLSGYSQPVVKPNYLNGLDFSNLNLNGSSNINMDFGQNNSPQQPNPSVLNTSSAYGLK